MEPKASFDWGADLYPGCQRPTVWKDYAADIQTLSGAFRKVQDEYWKHRGAGAPLLNRLLRRVRARLAEFLCFPYPEHVIFSTGTFHGLDAILRTLLGAKVAFLTSSHEISQTYQLLSSELPASAKVPVCSVVRWEAEATPEQIVASFESATRDLARASSRAGFTLVLYLSWVTYDLGFRVPVAEIAKSCRTAWNLEVFGNPEPGAEQLRRARSRLLIIADLSHVVGNIEMAELLPRHPGRLDRRLDSTEVDAVIGDAHKWLQGPHQSGFLLPIRRDFLDRVIQRMPNTYAVDPNVGRHAVFCSKSEMVLGAVIPLGLALDRFRLAMQYQGWGQAARRLISGLIQLFERTPLTVEQQRFRTTPTNIITLSCPNLNLLESLSVVLWREGIAHTLFDRRQLERAARRLAHLHPPEAFRWIASPPFIRFCVSDVFNSPADEELLLSVIERWRKNERL